MGPGDSSRKIARFAGPERRRYRFGVETERGKKQVKTSRCYQDSQRSSARLQEVWGATNRPVRSRSGWNISPGLL